MVTSREYYDNLSLVIAFKQYTLTNRYDTQNIINNKTALTFLFCMPKKYALQCFPYH